MTEDGPKAAPCLVQFDEVTGEQVALRPTRELGPAVISDDSRGMQGRVHVIRYNPLEGSSNFAAQVATRGNCDYQDMRRTFVSGLAGPRVRDELRDPPLSDEALAEQERQADAAFAANLPALISAAQQERKKKGQLEQTDEQVGADLRRQYESQKDAAKRGTRVGDRLLSPQKRRFKKWVHSMVVEAMQSSIAASFYCLLYTSPSPRDRQKSRMPSSA